MNNSNNNINDQIKIEVSEFQFNDVNNEPKPFGFHIAIINIPISVVLIKRVMKRRWKICKYVLKKSYKKKIQKKDKRVIKSIEGNVENTEHVKEEETFDPKEFTGDRKWCWDEFERHIGVPERMDVPLSIATDYIRKKSCRRFIPEAKNLRKPIRNDSIFLALDEPRSNCLCPDHECLCFGTGIIDKRAKIPKKCSCWCPRILKILLQTFKTSSRRKANINNFVKKMIAATNAPAKKKEEMYKNVLLRKELCLSRCIKSYVTGKLHTIQYTPVGNGPKEVKKEVKAEEVPVIEKVEDDDDEDDDDDDGDDDDRVCNVVNCTVSTETENAPNGDLIMGNFKHLLYSNNQETFLNDIRGNKLQISHYTYIRPKPLDLPVCTKNIEKFLNFKEMKVRLRNLISSIYVIKDPGTPVRSGATQVPWRKSRIFKIGAPNSCGDEDYENLKKVSWNFKIQEVIFDETRRLEAEKEQTDGVCPCCEYFADSVDKKALLEKMKNTLTMPGGEKDQLGESITIVKKIIGEIVANAVDDFYEKEKNKVLPERKKATKINPKQNKFVDKGKVELSKDLPSNNEMNHRSSIKNSKNLIAQIIPFDTKNTSKDKIVLQVDTSYKKASSAFSSLFKWLFDPSTPLRQIIKTSSVMSLSKDKLSTDILSTDLLYTDKLPTDTKITRDAKSSEREVFSIRYTSSAISVNKSTSLENDK